MGYSARYHAASLAAVFLALGVGLLLGAGFGDDVITGTAENLQQSLESDLDDAQARIAALEEDLAREGDFGEAVYPALAADTLVGRDLAVVAFGGRSDELREDIEEALRVTGAQVRQLAVVREPPDVAALAELVADDPRRSQRERAELTARRAGASLVDGGDFFGRARESLLSSFSGTIEPMDGVIVIRQRPELGGQDEIATERMEQSFIGALEDAGVPVIGVERTDADPSSIAFFDSLGLTTVDHLDLRAGKVALVYALRGAQGNFGIGEEADELLPAVLRRPAP